MDLWQLPDPDHSSPQIKWIYEYWCGLAEAGLPPQRRRIDPLEIGRRYPGVLPHLWLMDIEDSPLRFRYRLVGGVIQEAGGVAKVGDYADQYESADVLVPLFSRIANSNVPHYRKGPPVMDHNRYVKEAEVLFMPLCDGEDRVCMLLNCTVYHWQPGYDDRMANLR